MSAAASFAFKYMGSGLYIVVKCEIMSSFSIVGLGRALDRS